MTKKKYKIEDLFDFTRTDKPSYTKILRADVKHKEGLRHPIGEVVMMSPEEALKKSYAKTDILKEKLRHPKYKPGDFKVKWPLPYIDTLSKRGFGRGRLLLCRHWGIKEVPVLVVARSKKDIKKWIKDKNAK